MKHLFLSGLLALVVVAGALAGPSDPEDQSATRSITFYRTVNDTTRVLGKDANTVGLHCCPDSINGLSTVDTTGTCIQIYWDSGLNTWLPPAASIYPNGTDFRQAVTVYAMNGGGGDPDTVVARGMILDQGAPKVGSVDSSAVGLHVLDPVHADSTATWILNGLASKNITIRQTVTGEVAIDAYMGTADNTGTIMRIGGSGQHDVGTGIKFTDWSGPALTIDRKGGAASSPYDAITIDMSDEADTANVSYGQSIDYGGSGTVNGLEVFRNTGSRKAATYGVKILGDDPAITDSSSISYGLHSVMTTVESVGGKNVAVYAEADTTNDGRSLLVKGDLEVQDIGGNAAILSENGSITLSDSTYAADDLTINGVLELRNYTYEQDAVRDSLDGDDEIKVVLVANVSDIIADGYFCLCEATPNWNWYQTYNEIGYTPGASNNYFQAHVMNQTVANGDSVEVHYVNGYAGKMLPFVVRCWAVD